MKIRIFEYVKKTRHQCQKNKLSSTAHWQLQDKSKESVSQEKIGNQRKLQSNTRKFKIFYLGESPNLKREHHKKTWRANRFVQGKVKPQKIYSELRGKR